MKYKNQFKNYTSVSVSCIQGSWTKSQEQKGHDNQSLLEEGSLEEQRNSNVTDQWLLTIVLSSARSGTVPKAALCKCQELTQALGIKKIPKN